MPFPVPRQGIWVDCWLDNEHSVNRCWSEWSDGTFIYEGPFVRFEGSGAVPQSELQIDTKATGNSVYFNELLVPIVHLRNGTILIPSEATEEARRQTLAWLRQHQNP
jgi:hypothetical protein